MDQGSSQQLCLNNQIYRDLISRQVTFVGLGLQSLFEGKKFKP